MRGNRRDYRWWKFNEVLKKVIRRPSIFDDFVKY